MMRLLFLCLLLLLPATTGMFSCLLSGDKLFNVDASLSQCNTTARYFEFYTYLRDDYPEAASDDIEGSADGDVDDEDLNRDPDFHVKHGPGLGVAGSTGEDEIADHFTLVVVIVAVSALTLSVAAIVTIMLVKRQMHRQQQGVYSVPIEQHQKGV